VRTGRYFPGLGREVMLGGSIQFKDSYILSDMRLGLVGYGMGGRYFHAPFIEAAEGVDLAAVVTRSPQRRAELASDHPGVPAYDSLDDLLSAGIDAVTITTPPQTRRELVLQAVAAGVHVVADKPFAPSSDGARELVAAAATAGVALNVFHNRRWDSDIRTVAALLARGELGEVTRVVSRFDLDDPATLDAGPDGGLLRDLGAHLVDQALWLFGPARHVHAELDWVDLAEGRTDCGFTLSITHADGVVSLLSSTKLNRLQEREWRVYGSNGAYVARGSDVQASAVFAGRRPRDLGDAWGYEDESRWGVLHTVAGATPVPSERGAYQDYYTQFAAAVLGEAPFPVPAVEAIPVIDVLDAARTSALEHRVVTIGPAA
jgi:predicted dehydrogenase